MSLRTVTALLTVTACMIMVSCSGKGRSDDQDFYFTTMKSGGEDQVSFDIDLSDTTRVYAISLVSRFKKDAECRNVTFTVSLTSPSGQSGSERVTLPSDYRTVKDYIKNSPEDGRIQAASAPGYYDISWLYRSNIRPQEYGEWTMTVSAVPEAGAGIIGIGVVINKIPLAGQ